MPKIKVKHIKNKQKINVRNDSDFDLMIEEYYFDKLSKKYARHFHEITPDECIICDSIKRIIGGQIEVDYLLSGRDLENELSRSF